MRKHFQPGLLIQKEEQKEKEKEGFAKRPRNVLILWDDDFLEPR